MTITQETDTSASHFHLPGYEGEIALTWKAYADGMNAYPSILLPQIRPGEPVPPAVLIGNMPSRYRAIKDLGKGTAEQALKRGDFTTNTPDLFIEHYAREFTAGYRFTQVSLQEVLTILHPVPEDKRMFALLYFSWEYTTGTIAPGQDAQIAQAVNALRALNKKGAV